MFCKYCGASNPNNASFCGDCGESIGVKPPGPSVPQPEPQTTPFGATPTPLPEPLVTPPGPAVTPVPPPARKSSRRAWIGISIILVVLVALISRILLSGPEPEDSFNQARMAYLNHDQVNFDKYVDVQSVLSDWADQAANGWLQEEHAGVGGTLLVQAAVQVVKSAYLPSMSQSIDHLVVSGNLMQQPQSNGGNQTDAFIAGLLSSWVHTLVSSQLTYKGVASESVSGNESTLRVNVLTPLRSQPVVVTIKMQKDGDHWRVVAVQDLAGLLHQLGNKTTSEYGSK